MYIKKIQARDQHIMIKTITEIKVVANVIVIIAARNHVLSSTLELTLREYRHEANAKSSKI